MGRIRTIHGQPSYTVENHMVRVAVTVQGGHLTPTFVMKNGAVDPFFTAPWWNETLPAGTSELIRVLRGDFFCFPFGNGELPHGETANGDWDLDEARDSGSVKELAMSMDLSSAPGRVEKRIKIVEGETVVYMTHTVRGYSGEMPLGHHPILRLPEREGAGILDMTPPVAGFTTPTLIEEPSAGGYSRLMPDREIVDRSSVPAADGSVVDLTRYPTPKGFEDLVCFISDPRKDFCFSSVSVPDEGYLYYQLKNPKLLAETVLWMSNGGRHYPPWSGRVSSVLGLEEITGFYHFGREASMGPSFFRDRGYPTTCSLDPSHPTRIPFIFGVVPIDSSFKGVVDIQAKNDEWITIRGRGGESIDVRCRVGSLTAD